MPDRNQVSYTQGSTKYAATSENVPSDVCAQRGFRSAFASAQCDQRLRADNEYFDLTVRVKFDGRICQKVYLTICLWLGPPWFNYWFSFALAYSRISHEYSFLFICLL